MESSNAVLDVSSAIAMADNANQVMSAVPDLVTDVSAPPLTNPTASSGSTTTTSSTPATNNHTAGSVKATSAPSVAPAKHRSVREDKSRKKDDKSVDHVLRALNSLNTSEEKLAAMCKKYADIFDEHRKLQMAHKQSEKRCSLLQREKEQLQAEHSKAILTRSRLENLCRELQRQNKAVKDESLLKIREEEEKRKEVSAKFQTTMNEITTLMQQNNDKNMKLRDDNIDMTSKLKNICEQYELRQQQVERISKQMQLEQQLADAKLSKLRMEMAAERETLLRDKQQLLMELQQYQQRCTELQATEVSLRGQISMYNDKYDEFQKALARSNDVFGGFKGEMEKMSKKICKLEKETSSWKQRWERSHTALLEMAADKQKSEQELGVVSRQLATLQGLCRALQQERANLLDKLKALQGGEPEPPTEQCTNSCDHPVLDLKSCGVQDPSIPAPANLLPDVVGAATNGPSCERLERPVEPITNGEAPPVIAKAEDGAVVNSDQTPAVIESLPPVMANGDAHSDSSPPTTVSEPPPPASSNGEAPPTSQPPADASTPPKTPTSPAKNLASPAKSQDSGKKTKESAKKKKK